MLRTLASIARQCAPPASIHAESVSDSASILRDASIQNPHVFVLHRNHPVSAAGKRFADGQIVAQALTLSDELVVAENAGAIIPQ